MILHTLNALPDSAACGDCLALAAPGDAILLLGDGVYCALPHSPVHQRLSQCGAELYCLAPDAAARGVAASLTKGVPAVDYAGFVELTERFPRQLAWF